MRHISNTASSFRPSRLVVALWVGAPITILAACGGGPPDMSRPEAQPLLSAYSGTWVLDTIASDAAPDPRGEPREGQRGGDPFGGGAPRGGGMSGGGGMPPGGAGGRGGPGGGGRAQMGGDAMQAARHLMTAARQRPDRIALTLDATSFTVDPSTAGRVTVPVSGDEIEIDGRGWPTKAKMQWDDLQPRLEVTFDQGGKITDRYEVVDRDRLIVTRSFDAGRGGSIQLRFAYDRDGG